MNAETAALRAIESAISEQGPITPAPEVDAALQFANMISTVVNERDGFRHESAVQRQRIAGLEREIADVTAEFEANFAQYRVGAEAEISRLRAQVEELLGHADFFRNDADQLRDSMSAIERIVERAKFVDRDGHQQRAETKRAVAAVAAPDDDAPFGAPKPRFLKGAPERPGNVTSITRLKAVHM